MEVLDLRKWKHRAGQYLSRDRGEPSASRLPALAQSQFPSPVKPIGRAKDMPHNVMSNQMDIIGQVKKVGVVNVPIGIGKNIAPTKADNAPNESFASRWRERRIIGSNQDTIALLAQAIAASDIHSSDTFVEWAEQAILPRERQWPAISPEPIVNACQRWRVGVLCSRECFGVGAQGIDINGDLLFRYIDCDGTHKRKSLPSEIARIVSAGQAATGVSFSTRLARPHLAQRHYSIV